MRAPTCSRTGRWRARSRSRCARDSCRRDSSATATPSRPPTAPESPRAPLLGSLPRRCHRPLLPLDFLARRGLLGLEVCNRPANLLSTQARAELRLRAAEDFLAMAHFRAIPLRDETFLLRVDGGLCRRWSLGGRGGRGRRWRGRRWRGRRLAGGRIAERPGGGTDAKAREHCSCESHDRFLPSGLRSSCTERAADGTLSLYFKTMTVRRSTKPMNAERSADPEAVRAAAIALLARRDFARAELHAKLRSKGFEAAAAEEVVAGLAARGVIDDRRFAENYVNWHAQRGQGPIRIAAELRRHGVPDALVDAALAGGPDWRALASRARRAKFGGQPPASWTDKARQARFLQYRGFSSDHIRAATGADLDTD
ncbi:MAG: regulatory protein RecX [Gammaproteobacteria bacterium]|nr:MAG: regulatory protein RecX [Gammaproteobacteria bacterium]